MKRAFVIIALGCGSTEHRPSTAPALLPPPEVSHVTAPRTSPIVTEPQSDDPRIAKMLRIVSKRRALVAKKSVPGATISREELLARVKEHVAREVPHQAIVDEG